jgi:hypothetical protein
LSEVGLLASFQIIPQNFTSEINCAIENCAYLVTLDFYFISMVQVNPADVIYSLNSLRPQCPVLFNSITFSYINSEERVRRAYRRLESSGESYSSVGPMHIPTSNYDHVEEEQRSYVFPSCGHVHGYHKSLQDRYTTELQ